MTEKSVDTIQEINYMPMLPENNNFIFLTHADDDSTENDSATLIISEHSDDRKGDHMRRFSTGDVAIPYTKVKILSRYLASSASSCHDYCKYGTKLDSETKTRNRILKGIREKQGRDIDKTATDLPEIRKKTFSVGRIQSQSPGSKSHKYNVPFVNRRNVSSDKKDTVLPKELSLPLKPGEQKVLVRPSTTLSSSINKVLVRPVPLEHPVKGIPKPKDPVKVESELPAGIGDVPDKTLRFIENDTMEVCRKADDASIPDHKSKKCAQNVFPAAESAKKVLRHTKHRIHATQLPPDSDKKHAGHLRTPIFSSASSKNNRSGKLSEFLETNVRNTKASKLSPKTRLRKGRLVCTTNADAATRKVNFRAGKVGELQPEIRTQRRIKFRRRAFSDGQISEVLDTSSKIKLKKKQVCDGETNAAKIESEKVVLRHQDMQEKKLVQSLLNNMIEERAGKLVESRKSKVKALVAAFETAISLQDSKPAASPTIGAC